MIVKNSRAPTTERTAIFELSTNDEHLDSRNNVYFSTVAPRGKRPVGMLGDRDGVTSGIASFAGDWVRDGWGTFDLLRGSGTEVRARITGFDALARGENPGFRGGGADGGGAEDYRLPAGGRPVALAPEIPNALLPNAQYVVHKQGRARVAAASWGALDD